MTTRSLSFPPPHFLPFPTAKDPVPQNRWYLSIYWTILIAFALGFVLLPVFWDYVANDSRFLSPDGHTVSVGMDFDARYNEICCVREGTDPYLIRTGEAHSDIYAHYLAPASHPPKRRIDAYSPWSYTFFLWLSFLPEQVAWTVFYALMLFSLGVLPFFAFRVVSSATSSTRLACLCALGSLFLGFPITACLYAGNYCLIVAAALCLLLWAVQTGHRLWAACAWALMMVKPQTAALLAVPLLILGEFRICAFAFVICVGAAILPSVLCGQALHVMILEIFGFGATVATQTKLLPNSVMTFLAPLVPLSVSNIFSALVGSIACIFLTFRLKNSPSSLMRFLPAIVLASFWTYCLPYNDCILAIPQFLFLYVALAPFSWHLKWPAVCCFCLIPMFHMQRAFSAENAPWTLCRLLGCTFPDSSFPVRFLSVIHILASYVFLVVFIIFCLRFAKEAHSAQVTP